MKLNFPWNAFEVVSEKASHRTIFSGLGDEVAENAVITSVIHRDSTELLFQLQL